MRRSRVPRLLHRSLVRTDDRIDRWPRAGRHIVHDDGDARSRRQALARRVQRKHSRARMVHELAQRRRSRTRLHRAWRRSVNRRPVCGRVPL